MPNAISAVGTLAKNTPGNGVTTLTTYTPGAVGNVAILGVRVASGTVTVASVSGGGVSSWQRIAGPGANTTIPVDVELWMGVITTADGTAKTITITGSASLTSIRCGMSVQELGSGGGSGTTWAVDGTQAATKNNTTSSTTVTYPTLTPGGTLRAYLGAGGLANAGGTTGQTAGYTVQNDGDADPLIYNLSVSTAQSPTSTQSPTGQSVTAAALITATNPTGGRGGQFFPFLSHHDDELAERRRSGLWVPRPGRITSSDRILAAV